MKLIIMHSQYGHLELAETDTVQTGTFAGLTQREMFEKIMTTGYGKNMPAIFNAEYRDGTSKVFNGKDAAGIIDDPNVETCYVLAPMAGG